MKAKYKLGMMVEVGKAGEPAFFGTINEVVQKQDGYWYQVGESTNYYAETTVVRAYKPMITRKVTKAGKTQKKATNRNQDFNSTAN